MSSHIDIFIDSINGNEFLYEAMTMSDLKEELLARQLQISGNKSELIDRLLLDDNRYFVNSSIDYEPYLQIEQRHGSYSVMERVIGRREIFCVILVEKNKLAEYIKNWEDMQAERIAKMADGMP